MKKINNRLSLKKEVIAQLDKTGLNRIGGIGELTGGALATGVKCLTNTCGSDKVACYPTYRCTNNCTVDTVC